MQSGEKSWLEASIKWQACILSLQLIWQFHKMSHFMRIREMITKDKISWMFKQILPTITVLKKWKENRHVDLSQTLSRLKWF